MSKHITLLTIGAGPTGLGVCEYFYRNRDTIKKYDYKIIEAQSKAGGYATTIEHDGFRWDYGGHVLYSKNKFFVESIERATPNSQFNFQERNAKIYHNNNFIDYPFQKNINQLTKEEQICCLHGIVDAQSRALSSYPRPNMDGWSKQIFGEGICKLFFRPYNFKVWGYSLEKLDSNWIANFVAPVNLKESIKDVIMDNPNNAKWGPNRIFRYPDGGIGVLWDNLAKQYLVQAPDSIGFNQTIIKINPKTKIVDIKDNSTEKITKYTYEHLVSTMPILDLINVLEDVPEEIVELSKKLLHSTTHVVGIGIEGPIPELLKDKHWMYFADMEIPFYRLTVLSNYSKTMTPSNKNKEYYSLMCEICESIDKPIDFDPIEATINSLIKIGFIVNINKVVSKFHRAVDYGYPTPFYGRNDILKKINEYLEQHNIYSRGRFGSHIYEISNMDDSFCVGYEITRRIVEGIPEEKFGYK
tara:strand:- start:10886 stop:12295 length:1410 start_codon:yes stop_codon:yes gene_type:complete